jgi:hypothetical protein
MKITYSRLARSFVPIPESHEEKPHGKTRYTSEDHYNDYLEKKRKKYPGPPDSEKLMFDGIKTGPKRVDVEKETKSLQLAAALEEKGAQL